MNGGTGSLPDLYSSLRSGVPCYVHCMVVGSCYGMLTIMAPFLICVGMARWELLLYINLNLFGLVLLTALRL